MRGVVWNMKYTRCMLVGILVVCCMCRPIVSKADDTDESITYTCEAGVTWSIPSVFSVVIPKRVVFDGTLCKGSYIVKVKGDIGSNKMVKVIPNQTVLLSRKGKKDIEADVVQSKLVWEFDELSLESYANATGRLLVEELTDGIYRGELLFTVILCEIAEE